MSQGGDPAPERPAPPERPTRRLTDLERAEHARGVVASAIGALRAGDQAETNALLVHAVHDGVSPSELLAEIVAQTGGRP
jgi:hypothetical protein